MKKDAEYYRKYRATKRKSATKTDKPQPGNATATKSATNTLQPVAEVQPGKNTTIWHPEIDQSIFDGKGRFFPVDGYVLISLGRVPDDMPEHGVVTEKDWLARLDHKCKHGYSGWTCKACL